MSKMHSTPAAKPGKLIKPAKPYPDFPLCAHAARVWAKQPSIYFDCKELEQERRENKPGRWP
jgi:hypothetical protein